MVPRCGDSQIESPLRVTSQAHAHWPRRVANTSFGCASASFAATQSQPSHPKLPVFPASCTVIPPYLNWSWSADIMGGSPTWSELYLFACKEALRGTCCVFLYINCFICFIKMSHSLWINSVIVRAVDVMHWQSCSHRWFHFKISQKRESLSQGYTFIVVVLFPSCTKRDLLQHNVVYINGANVKKYK